MRRYKLYVTPAALKDLRELPGHIRQRARRAVDNLVENPRSEGARRLELGEGNSIEAWRLRIDSWRIVYTISDADGAVDVIAVRKRPPYDYGDLQRLLDNFA